MVFVSQGVYDRQSRNIHLFQRGDRRKKISATIVSYDDPDLPEIIGKEHFEKLQEDIEMLDSLIPEADIELIQVILIYFY